MALTKNEILRKDRFASKVVDVPGLGAVRIQQMNVAQVQKFGAASEKATKAAEAGNSFEYFATFCTLICLCVINDQGEREFTDKDADNIAQSLTTDQAMFLGNEIIDLSKISKTEQVVEEIAKNSESDQITDSVSD